MIHRTAGQAVFTHECDKRRHAITVSWGAGYPALDVNSLPQVLLPDGRSQFCECGEDYNRVDPCPIKGNHTPIEGCVIDPIAGHVLISDDHTANLISLSEFDPDEVALKKLRLQKWQLETKHYIKTLEELLAANKLPELQKVAAQIALIENKRVLRMTMTK